MRVSIDISKPLLRCRKLWVEGKQISWVGFKFERLPNFCYWCGRVTHGEVWLSGKGNLRKEDQQFSEWLRADSIRLAKKSVTIILGSSRSQAPWWRKPGSKVHSSTGQSEEASDRGFGYENIVEVGSPVTMVRDIEGLKFNNKEGPKVSKKNKESCANSFPCRENVGSHANNSPPMPLGDCTNVSSPQIPAQ